MPTIPKRKKFNWLPFQSYVVAFVFAIGFASFGTYSLLKSGASGTRYEIQLYSDRGKCLDNKNNSGDANNPTIIWTCSSTDPAQLWSFPGASGGFLIKDTAGTCVDDPGGAVGTSSTNRVYVRTSACNTADHTQIWKWYGSSSPQELKNAYNSGCINDTANNTTNGTQMIVYPCSPEMNDARWVKVAVSIPTPSVTITSPTANAKISGTVSVSAQAGVSSGSITNLSISINNGIFVSCANSTTCSKTWNTATATNGQYSIVAHASASAGGSSSSAETITVSNAGPKPPPPSPNPSPNPSPTPSPGPSPFTGNGSGEHITITPNPSPSPTSPPPDTSENLSFGTVPSTSANPMAADVQATSITSSSITLSWEGTNANSYTIKYGTDSNNLNNTRTLSSTDAVPTYTLTKLSPNQTYYITITPSSSSATGSAVNAKFKTKAKSNVGIIFLWVLLTLILIMAFMFFMVRRRLNLEDSVDDADLTTPPPDVPLYPREDEQQEAERLNWWMPEEERHKTAHLPGEHEVKPPDDIPDMYEEGRKRLDDEEKKNHHPGS